jgi:hypothetical protein
MEDVEYFTVIWNISRTFGILYGHLVNVVFILVFFPRFCFVLPRKPCYSSQEPAKDEAEIAAIVGLAPVEMK